MEIETEVSLERTIGIRPAWFGLTLFSMMFIKYSDPALNTWAGKLYDPTPAVRVLTVEQVRCEKTLGLARRKSTNSAYALPGDKSLVWHLLSVEKRREEKVCFLFFFFIFPSSCYTLILFFLFLNSDYSLI